MKLILEFEDVGPFSSWHDLRDPGEVRRGDQGATPKAVVSWLRGNPCVQGCLRLEFIKFGTFECRLERLQQLVNYRYDVVKLRDFGKSLKKGPRQPGVP